MPTRTQGSTLVLLAAALALALAAPLAPTASLARHNGCEEPPDPPHAEPRRPAPARLDPQGTSVALAHGETRDLRWTLFRPASPTPVDVYFTVDTTGSMGSAICGVQRDLSQIAVDLAESGIDARFGLGIYRDYPFSPWGSEGDFAYRRVRDLAPLGRALLRDLHELEAGGGGDGLESALAALYQSATGAGQDVPPKGASAGDIARRGHASFRADALRLIVNVTDVDFREPEPEQDGEIGAYPGPAFDVVARALSRRRIMQAGIAVAGGGRSSLERMASRTGAVAPRGGADCDGDGRSDVAAGGPLVCDGRFDDVLEPVTGGQPPVRMAEAIVAIVRALRDEERIRFRVEGDRSIVDAPPAAASAIVDLKRDTTLPVGLRLRCDRDPGRKRVRVIASVRGHDVAQAAIEATCDPPPAAGSSFTRAAPPAPAGGQPAQQPAPQSNPQPNPNPQAQADPAAHVNAALAPAAQEQPQTAIARAYDALQRDMPMEMRAARSRMPGGAALLSGAVAVAMGCAAVARGAVRTGPARAEARWHGSRRLRRSRR